MCSTDYDCIVITNSDCLDFGRQWRHSNSGVASVCAHTCKPLSRYCVCFAKQHAKQQSVRENAHVNNVSYKNHHIAGA